MIKVLGLALYGPLAASTRYRIGQYVPGLAANGIDVHVRHLLGDEYLRRRFVGGSMPWGEMSRASMDRLRDLRGQESFDLMMLYGELFPMAPAFLERGLLRRPYIYDFDDAFYLKYRSGRWAGLSPVLGNKFDHLMAGASAITAGNSVLMGYAKQHNAATYRFPTVVDVTRYLPQERPENDMFTVGWIGSPSTAPYLSELIAPLSDLGKEGAVRLVVIGGKAPIIPGVTTVEMEWQEETEIDLINTFDVGVMPLPDDDWARGKCAFKLIQYMACGVPVVASPVGANVDLVREDCGLLATTAQQWLDALRKLRDQASLRKEMGRAGRERVCKDYSLQGNLPILAEIIRGIAERGQ